MKSIKTTFVRGLSLLLALVILLNLPIAAFAATDNGIEPYAYTYDAARSRMIDSYIYRALKYLKYDRYNELEDNGYLFTPEYVAVDLLNKYESGALSNYPLTDITYNSSSSGAFGTAYTTNANGQNVPDVAEFEEKGLMCASFIEYYFINYLYRVEKLDVNYLISAYNAAKQRINNGTQKYGIDTWYEAVETLVADGVATVHRFDQEDSIAPDDGEDETADHQRYMEMFDTLPIGALIRFGYPDYGSYNDEFRHFGIYAGTYNGVHYMIHIGNSRGPEITVVEYMATTDASKRSYPLAFYVLPNTVTDTYGTIEIYKSDENGSPLAGAYFLAVNQDTGEEIVIGPTNATGKASIEKVPLGTYTITETVAPEGYEKVDTVWTVKLTEADPTGGGPIYVTNTRLKGNLQIIKDILPSSAAIPGNLAGWKFNIYMNSPSYTTTIRDGVMYRVKVTDKNGNSVYSDTTTLKSEVTEPVEEPAIKITAQPKNTSASAGSTAKFTVAAKSTTGKALTYQWYYRNANSTSWTKSTTASGQSATYSFSMYNSYDGRTIKCLISDGTNEVWTEEVKLYLPTSLGVNIDPSDASAIIGLDATFTATFFGSPTSFLWQYSADGGITWTNCSGNAPFNCANYTTATLTVTASDAISGYQFRCVATKGSATATTDAATLTAEPAYIFTTSPNQGAFVEIGGTGNFYVGVAGGNLSYQWQIWTAESGVWTDIEGANTGNTLSLTMTEEYSNSRVRLQVTQGNEVIYSTPITFATPDTLCITTDLVATMSGNDGENVTLSVTANGEGLVYQWEVSTDGGSTWSSVMEPIVGSPYTTGDDGTVTINGLPIGDYYVQEIDTGRNNWVYDLTPKAVTVTENATVSVTFTNELINGSITVTKKILPEGSGGSVAGWIVDLYKVNDDGTTTYLTFGTTGEDGTYTFTDLEAGRYIVKESDRNNRPGYTLDTKEYGVDVLPGADTPVTITNTQLGSGKINKDTTNGGIKAGWQFKVWTDTAELGIFTTDENGEIDLGYLQAGTVYVQEIGHESMTVEELRYWILDDEIKTLVIKDGQVKSVSFENRWFGIGRISKDTTNGGTKEGWQFKVWTDAAELGIFTTDENGEIDLGLIAPGTIYIQEIGHINMTAEELSYWLKDAEVKELEIVAGQIGSVSFANQWLGKGQINKDTTNGGTKAGWQFKVWTDATELGIFTTDENGEIDLGLITPGTVYVQEIGHISMAAEQLRYWIMDTEIKALEIEAGTTKSVTFENTWLGELQIQKDAVNSTIIAGWTGDLYKVNVDGTETRIGTYTSDAEGKFIDLLVAPGKYIFRETGHADSAMDLTYWVMSSDVEIEVSAGATASATMTNTEFGKGQIKKDTTNGGTKAGWQFKAWTDAAALGIFTTDENGEIDLGLLAPGTIYIQEIGHKDMTTEQLRYWIMDAEIKTLEIVAGETRSVTFENQWLGKGQILKTMADGTSPVGYEFEVIAPDGKPISGSPFKITDENGVFFLGDLEPGEYIVREIVPEGSIYQPVGGAEKTLTVVAGETTSVKFVNALRAGEIIINKVDGSNDAALKGAKFLLEWLDNDVWTPVIYSDTIIPGGCASVGLENGCLTSDENGKVFFYGLHPDYQYRLTEVDAPDGYILQAGTIFEGTLPVDTLSSEHTVYNHPNFVLPSTGVDNNFRWLEIFTLCLLAAFALAVGYALNTIRVTRGKNRK